MALVQCRECGEKVSNKAATCPKCGIATPGGAARSGDAFVGFGLILVLGFGLYLFLRDGGPSLEERLQHEAAMKGALRAAKREFPKNVVQAGGWSNWSIAGVEIGKEWRHIRVRVAVPDGEANDLFGRAPEHQFTATSGACPRQGAAVYKALPKDNRLYLDIGTKRDIHISVDCNYWAWP